MKRVGLGFPVALVAAAFLSCSATVLHAGEINLVPVVSISGEWSDNVFYESHNQRSDTFIFVTPGVAFDYATAKTIVSLSYEIGIQRFSEFDERDNTAQRLDGNIGFSISPSLQARLSDNLVRADDPLAFDASGDRIQRDSFTYNRFSPALSYTGHGMFASGAYERIDIDYTHLVDSSQNGLHAQAGHKLGTKSTLNGDFVYFRREFAEKDPFVDNYDGYRVGVNADRQVTPKLSLQGFVGYEWRYFDHPGQPNNDFKGGVYMVGVTGEFPGVFGVTANVTRRLNDLAAVGVYTITRFDAEVRRSWFDRVRTSFSGYYEKLENNQLTEEANYSGVRLRGEYLLAKFLNLYAGYEYLNRDSVKGGIASFSENRVNFGVTVSYGL